MAASLPTYDSEGLSICYIPVFDPLYFGLLLRAEDSNLYPLGYEPSRVAITLTRTANIIILHNKASEFIKKRGYLSDSLSQPNLTENEKELFLHTQSLLVPLQI